LPVGAAALVDVAVADALLLELCVVVAEALSLVPPPHADSVAAKQTAVNAVIICRRGICIVSPRRVQWTSGTSAGTP
jgi:hypothetical protein